MPKREKYTGSFLGRESKTKIQSGGGMVDATVDGSQS